MADLAAEFGVPAELRAFVDNGFLEVLSEKPAEKTVEFHIPTMHYTDDRDAITTFSLIWIHPDHNADFCHYFHEIPGDLPNFYVTKDTTDSGDEQIDGLETVDDLVDWLEQRRSAFRP